MLTYAEVYVYTNTYSLFSWKSRQVMHIWASAHFPIKTQHLFGYFIDMTSLFSQAPTPYR